MQVGGFTLHLIAAGRPAPEYGHDGRVYVAGRAGDEYVLRVGNRTGRRVKAVLSVDGVNVVDGRPTADSGGGYVVEPYGSYDVPGWRTDDGHVARFVFAAPEAGYGSASGEPTGGAFRAVFYNGESSGPGTPGVAPGSGESAGGAVQGSVGTGFGVRVAHPVRKVEFVAQPRPAGVVELRCEDAAILCGMNIDAETEGEVSLPTPDAAFCRPPRDWRG